MELNNKYNLGQKVFLYTDVDQLARMVTVLQVDLSGALLYKLACGTTETWHFEKEICADKNIDIALGINNN